MRVSGLSKEGDWRLGRGKALYLTESAAVAQKVVTRLRSFKRDWFLDSEAGIDWILLLGTRGTENTILREVERVIISTNGVLELTSLSMDVNNSERSATIFATYKDIYGIEFQVNEAIGV